MRRRLKGLSFLKVEVMLGVVLSGAAGSAEEVVGLPEMFVGATMLDGPVGPGRLPKESTARSGFSCSSPELWKGRITDVYETLSPLEAGSGVSIDRSSLSL